MLQVLKRIYWLPTVFDDQWNRKFNSEWDFASASQMRRWRNGSWEYRPTTVEEEYEYRSVSG